MKPCTYPGCPNERWLGPSGTNLKLTMCEEHQRAYWRQTKNKSYRNRRAGAPPSRRGRPRKPELNGAAASPPPRTSIRVSKKVAKPPTRKAIKVLCLDYNTRQMIHIEGVIVLDTPLPNDPLQAELLLETYGDYMIAEKGVRPQPKVVTEKRPAHPIPVRVFVELESAARRAAELEDWATFQAINARIGDIGGELVWRDGDLFLKSLVSQGVSDAATD